MKKLKFLDLLKEQEEIEKEILLTFSNLDQNHMIEDYANKWHIIRNNHMKEDHIDRQHVIWNFNVKDHVDRWYITGNITIEDHDDRHYVTNITMV